MSERFRCAHFFPGPTSFFTPCSLHFNLQLQCQGKLVEAYAASGEQWSSKSILFYEIALISIALF